MVSFMMSPLVDGPRALERTSRHECLVLLPVTFGANPSVAICESLNVGDIFSLLERIFSLLILESVDVKPLTDLLPLMTWMTASLPAIAASAHRLSSIRRMRRGSGKSLSSREKCHSMAIVLVWSAKICLPVFL
jgi:hypothetical protein